jgi:glutaredoxin 3
MSKKIIVYTTPICPECERAKRYFKDKKLNYQEIDVFENKEKGEKIFKKIGKKRVPIIEIGNEFFVGFNKKKIEETLNK